MNHFKNFIDVFDDEIDSLKYVISNLDKKNINKIIEKILNIEGRLIVSGIGKSGHIGKKIASTLASTGTHSFFIHSTEAFHGDLGMINSNDALLLISYSGETDEVLKVLDYANKNNIITLSITGNDSSTLATNSTFHICSNIIDEACSLNLAPTSSTTATLILGDAIAICLMKAKKFNEIDFAKYHPGGSLGKRLLTKVNDVMIINNLPIVSNRMNIMEIIFKISECGYGIAFLVEKNKLVGVITDGDIRRSFNNDKSFKNSKIVDLINKEYKFANLESNLEEIKNIMRDNKIITLPVIDSNKKILGLVQYYDI
tara:strand:- start:4919 stop:5860 length:942 start_codon:yes stop_codon:yes gene_type:complete